MTKETDLSTTAEPGMDRRPSISLQRRGWSFWRARLLLGRSPAGPAPAGPANAFFFSCLVKQARFNLSWQNAASSPERLTTVHEVASEELSRKRILSSVTPI